MCELCGTCDLRSYSHSKLTQHKKKLMNLFKEKKNIAEKQYGGYYQYLGIPKVDTKVDTKI